MRLQARLSPSTRRYCPHPPEAIIPQGPRGFRHQVGFDAFARAAVLLRQPLKVRGEHGKEVVSVQHDVPGFLDFLPGLLVALACEAFFDDGDGLFRLLEVDLGERFSGEIFFDIGAAVIDGVAASQKRVGDLFRPIIVDRAIFNGDVISVRGKGVPFVLDLPDSAPEHVNAVAEMILQGADKGKAQPMTVTEGLGGRDDGQFFSFFILGDGREFVVIL